jgi:hypothetical protein
MTGRVVADTDPRLERVQALNQRLDDLEEFRLPDIIEHDDGTPLASVTPPLDSRSKPRECPEIKLIQSNETILLKMLLDGIIVVVFVFSCVLLYNSIVWTIFGAEP